jgi:hypothetical protein
MIHKDSIVFSYLASAASKLIKEMASKHDEHGEFLPETRNPHLHKLKTKVLMTYCDLIIEIGTIMETYTKCRRTGKLQFKQWTKKLAHYRQLETKLHFDCFIDIGGDH